MLLGPCGGIGDLVPERGSSENLGEKRIGVECDALNELVELLRGHGRRRGLLGLLRVGGWRGWWRLVGLGLLLVGRWRRGWLTNDGGLCEGDRGKSQQCQSCQGFVNRLHTFVYLIPFAFCAFIVDAVLTRKLL